MASKKSQSYNAVLRSLKKDGLTHTQARMAWAGIKQRLGHSPTAAELKVHPRITRAAETKAAPPVKPPTKAPSRPARPPAGPGGAPSPGGPRVMSPQRFQEIVEEWENFELDWEDTDPYGE